MKIIVSTLLSFLISISAFSSEGKGIDRAELLLSLEQVQLQYQRLMHQYKELEALNEIKDPQRADHIVSTLIEKITAEVREHPEIKKRGAWKYIKHLFTDIRDEARVITREHGLAVSIVVLTIELTEIPMKAIALSLGSPVIIVLYEVLQPGILIPATILGVKAIANNIKIRNLFQDKALYKKWKKSKKQAEKESKTSVSGTEIGYEYHNHIYVIRNSNLLVNLLRPFGLFRKRLDYVSVKKDLRKRKVKTLEVEEIKKSNMPSQIKTKMILDIMKSYDDPYMGYMEKRYGKFRLSIEPLKLDDEYLYWVQDLLEARSKEETLQVFANLPRSVSPLIFFELWESKVKELFFEHNRFFNLRFYRNLNRNLIRVLVPLRRAALSSGNFPEWTPQLEEIAVDYFTLSALD